MLRETKKLLEETQEYMDLCMGQILNLDMLKVMSSEELEMYKKLMVLLEHTKELALEHARLMDDMDAKLDKLVMLLELKNEN